MHHCYTERRFEKKRENEQQQGQGSGQFWWPDKHTKAKVPGSIIDCSFSPSFWLKSSSKYI